MFRCTWISVALLTLFLSVPTSGLVSDFIKIKNVPNDVHLERSRNVRKLNKSVTSTRFVGPLPDFTRFGGSDIVGGYPAPFPMAKHLASVFILTTFGSSFFCTGSIITNYLVLTAAHCFTGDNDRFNIAGVALRFGAFSNKGKFYGVKYVDLFDAYNFRTSQNDVALVWFNGPIPASYSKVFVPKPSFKLRVKSKVFAAGFGRISTTGKSSNRAREVMLAYQNYFTCRKYWSFKSYKNWSPARIICITDPKFPFSGPRGTCFGDSGGPVYLKRGKNMFQQGIISFGLLTCAGKGSTEWAVNLKTYVPFIQQYVNKKYGRWVEVYDFSD